MNYWMNDLSAAVQRACLELHFKGTIGMTGKTEDSHD